jgi:hypothetical protein
MPCCGAAWNGPASAPPPLPASAASSAAPVNCAQLLFTFKSDKGHGEAASKYFTLLGIGWCINTGLMWLLVHQLGWYYWLAQVLATGIGLMWNFAGSRWWAFKPASVPGK